MKFYCEDCGRLYQNCKCKVYMSAYRVGGSKFQPYNPFKRAVKETEHRMMEDFKKDPLPFIKAGLQFPKKKGKKRNDRNGDSQA